MIDIIAAGLGGLFIYLIIYAFKAGKEKLDNIKNKEYIELEEKLVNLVRLRKESMINSDEFIEKMKKLEDGFFNEDIKENDTFKNLETAKKNNNITLEEHNEKFLSLRNTEMKRIAYPFTNLDSNYTEIFDLLWKDICAYEDIHGFSLVLLNKEANIEFKNIDKKDYKDLIFSKIIDLYHENYFKNEILNQSIKDLIK